MTLSITINETIWQAEVDAKNASAKTRFETLKNNFDSLPEKSRGTLKTPVELPEVSIQDLVQAEILTLEKSKLSFQKQILLAKLQSLSIDALAKLASQVDAV